MNTVITKEIDGYNIIVGIGQAQIDPVETKKAMVKKCENTPEKKEVERLYNEMGMLTKAKRDSYLAYMEAHRNKDSKKIIQFETELKTRDKQIEEIKPVMIEAIQAMKAKEREIWLDNVVYFTPRAGEKLITDKEQVDIMAALKTVDEKKAFISEDLKEIPDHRGVFYVKDGQLIGITKLGEVPDGKLTKDCTPEELEEIRISGLTQDGKAAEYEQAQQGLLAQASQMRSGLEIEGDKNALKKSQDFYNKELKKIQNKYGISN